MPEWAAGKDVIVPKPYSSEFPDVVMRVARGRDPEWRSSGSRETSAFIRQDLRIVIVTWLEKSYHRERRQRSRGRLTPIEFETIYPADLAQSCVTQPVTYSCSRPPGRFSGLLQPVLD